MRTRMYIFSCVAIIMISLVGCKEPRVQSEKIEASTTVEVPSSQMVEVSTMQMATSIKEEVNEYALYVDDIYYPLDANHVFESIMDGAEVKELSDGPSSPSGRIHTGDGLWISTYNVDDERGKGETINKIMATKSAKTPRGVAIGDTLSDLQKSYSKLKYETNWVPGDDDPMYNRVYIYADEFNRKYIAFYLNKKEIVMIAVVDADDHMPGIDIDSSNLLGIQGVLRETSNISTKGMAIHYFYTNNEGKEVTLLDLYALSTYEVDIDDDGIKELMIYLASGTNWQSIRIYDVVNGEISYIDVNQKMGCQWSSGVENCANLKPEYRNCIEIGFEKDDDTHKSGLYRVLDNELIYVCPYSNDVLM